MVAVLTESMAGMFLVALSVWWLGNQHQQYFSSLAKGRPFKSTPYFTCSFLWSNFPLESAAKMAFLFCVVVATVAKTSATKDQDGAFENLKHIPYYCLFMMACALEILSNYKRTCLTRIEYLVYFLGLVLQCIMLQFSRKDGDELIRSINHLTGYILALLAATTGLETIFEGSHLAAISRSYLTLVLGSWLICKELIITVGRHGFTWLGPTVMANMVTTATLGFVMSFDYLILLGIGLKIGKSYQRGRKTKLPLSEYSTDIFLRS